MLKLLRITRDASLMLIFVALVQVTLINAFLFPTCNRANHDCFLIDRLWPAKVTPEISDTRIEDAITYKWEDSHADR